MAALGGVCVGAAAAYLVWGGSSKPGRTDGNSAAADAERTAEFLGSQLDHHGLALAASKSPYFCDVKDYKLVLTKEEVRPGGYWERTCHVEHSVIILS